MSDLVVVYHRQPFEEQRIDGKTVRRPHRSPNGIVPTLRNFFQYFDSGSWLAWTAVAEGDQGKLIRNEPIRFDGAAYNIAQVGLTDAQVHSFYKVTSKAALWPILHSFPERFDYDAADWETFREVNQIFADAACRIAKPGALIWVHDYNLWLVPAMIRAQREDVRIAFFHHTPFPASDIFGILPWRKEIIESLLCCDRVGFHIPRYAENFCASARAFAGARGLHRRDVAPRMQTAGQALQETSQVTGLSWKDRTIAVDAAPLGVNAAQIRKIASSDASQRREHKIHEELAGQKLLFSVGRVDYTKGALEMLQAYERLLERHPEQVGKIKLCLTSVAPAAGMSVYDECQAAIEQQVGAINGRFSRLGWTPILLFTHAIPFDELISWYRAADVAWLTPLRDGLNLVAKEFIAARRDDHPGVLLLSEFCGAAVDLDGALLTHPYSHRNMDQALERALNMDKAEANARLQAMRKVVELHDLDRWIDDMLVRFDIQRPAAEPRDVA